MPRATTAAWLVIPPRAVSTARAATMPWKSSGVVSSRTRITASPFALRRSAVSGSNTALPLAAPGLAGRPAHKGCARLRVDDRVQELIELIGDDAVDRFRLRD